MTVDEPTFHIRGPNLPPHPVLASLPSIELDVTSQSTGVALPQVFGDGLNSALVRHVGLEEGVELAGDEATSAVRITSSQPL